MSWNTICACAYAVIYCKLAHLLYHIRINQSIYTPSVIAAVLACSSRPSTLSTEQDHLARFVPLTIDYGAASLPLYSLASWVKHGLDSMQYFHPHSRQAEGRSPNHLDQFENSPRDFRARIGNRSRFDSLITMTCGVEPTSFLYPE